VTDKQPAIGQHSITSPQIGSDYVNDVLVNDGPVTIIGGALDANLAGPNVLFNPDSFGGMILGIPFAADTITAPISNLSTNTFSAG
jgi:hypothetical protein